MDNPHNDLNFWEALAHARAGVPIRRVVWGDRWIVFDGALYWLCFYDQGTRTETHRHVVTSADHAVDWYRTPWTTAPISYSDTLPVRVFVRYATGTAYRYGFESYDARGSRWLTQEAHVKQDFSDTAYQTSAYGDLNGWRYRRDVDLLERESTPQHVNPKTNAVTPGPTPINRDRTGTSYVYYSTGSAIWKRLTWQNGEILVNDGSYSEGIGYWNLPDWANSGQWDTITTVISALSDTETRRLYTTIDIRSSDWSWIYTTGGASYWVNCKTHLNYSQLFFYTLSNQHTDEIVLQTAFEAKGGYGDFASSDLVYRASEERSLSVLVPGSLIYPPKVTATFGEYYLSSRIPPYDGYGHYVFTWRINDEEFTEAIEPEFGATEVTTAIREGRGEKIGEIRVIDPTVKYMPENLLVLPEPEGVYLDFRFRMSFGAFASGAATGTIRVEVGTDVDTTHSGSTSGGLLLVGNNYTAPLWETGIQLRVGSRVRIRLSWSIDGGFDQFVEDHTPYVVFESLLTSEVTHPWDSCYYSSDPDCVDPYGSGSGERVGYFIVEEDGRLARDD